MTTIMKLYSWNVNGFRAVLNKGFWEWFRQADADVVGLQEVKASRTSLPKDRQAPATRTTGTPARTRKGYSGVACFSKFPP
jgi:exodeoxyribonuclease III